MFLTGDFFLFQIFLILRNVYFCFFFCIVSSFIIWLSVLVHKCERILNNVDNISIKTAIFKKETCFFISQHNFIFHLDKRIGSTDYWDHSSVILIIIDNSYSAVFVYNILNKSPQGRCTDARYYSLIYKLKRKHTYLAGHYKLIRYYY